MSNKEKFQEILENLSEFDKEEMKLMEVNIMNNKDITVNKKDITIADVLKKLEDAPNDTTYSKNIFKIEEGAEDNKIKENDIKNKRRDWLILADIYNEGQYTQKFHLQNYLKFKLNDGYKETDNFYTCYKYLRNAALILYINEIIFKENEESLKKKYEEIEKDYKNNNNINNSGLAKMIRL